jgi:2-deoxy-D-gluconate 3-dehydrogenase
MRDLFDLGGRTALVTGATRGLGQAAAAALAGAGADVVAVSASQAAEGSETQRMVEATGRSFTGIACDFSDRSDTYRLLQRLREHGPRIDILVNNAGIIRRTPAVDHPDEDWDDVIEVNLTAPFIISRELARPMLERGFGKIVFIASVLSYQGGITVPGYAAAKHAIGGLTKALANEWAGSGVNVNAVAPGYMATDNTRALRGDPERSRAILDRIPAGAWGEPDDLAGAVIFLASPASNYVNGSVLTVDGGWLAR